MSFASILYVRFLFHFVYSFQKYMISKIIRNEKQRKNIIHVCVYIYIYVDIHVCMHVWSTPVLIF